MTSRQVRCGNWEGEGRREEHLRLVDHINWLAIAESARLDGGDVDIEIAGDG